MPPQGAFNAPSAGTAFVCPTYCNIGPAAGLTSSSSPILDSRPEARVVAMVPARDHARERARQSERVGAPASGVHVLS
jgi:hypothetical protein